MFVTSLLVENHKEEIQESVRDAKKMEKEARKW